MRERLINASPIFNLQRAPCATLLFAGEMDSWGSGPGQEAVYMSLTRKGVPTQLVMYWGENHNIESPGNVRDMINRERLHGLKSFSHKLSATQWRLPQFLWRGDPTC